MARSRTRIRKTTVGRIDSEVLAFTVGRDTELDLELVDADCIGSAAHVTMLARLPVRPRLFSPAERQAVLKELVAIMKAARQGKFVITLEDQDVHMAVERRLTARLGDLGKRIHTGRSRNDQVAVDLRLYARHQLVSAVREASALAGTLVAVGRTHAAQPMVGRTHMQPAMPSSVGLWATAHADSLLDDIVGLINAYELNDQCPLGAAAGYGVPLPLDRTLLADLLGFSRPCQNVLYAVTARGKMEAVVLSALSQVMTSLSRLAQDLILYSMPEFAYFTVPAEYGTGSSIMPQKNNPDVLELVRAKACTVAASAWGVCAIISGLPSGYNRDVQETKEPLINGFATTRASLRIMRRLVAGLKINKQALLKGFTPEVFATDQALELVGRGVPFREAYQQVKQHLDQLTKSDPYRAVAVKTSLGATAGLPFTAMAGRVREADEWAVSERKACAKAVSRLLGVAYPLR